MALTTGAAAAVAKPHHHLLYPRIKPFNLKPTATWSCSSSRVTASSSSKWVCMTKRRILEMSMGVLAAAAAGALMMPSDADATRIEYYATVSEPPCNFNFARSGLGYCDIALGTGDEPPLGQLIVIHYTARFADGTVFDSSYKRARPLTLRIGVGKVIKGLDQGIIGGEGVPPMLVGGKRKIQIPPQLAYGPEPAGCFSGDCNIPANATLIYDINYIGPYK